MKTLNLYLLLSLIFFSIPVFSQSSFVLNVDASKEIGDINPLWGDHWEYHFIHGYGGNPILEGPHEQYITDPSFSLEMDRLQPRFIRQSIGAFTNPPNADYMSADTSVLKSLWTEFYQGPNTLDGANDLSNYHFEYLDSLISVYNSIQAKPFLCLDYMPFSLSANKTPNANPIHLFAWDNGIRNSQPANFEVFGRVMYQTIKYAHDILGVEYFEFWNEPDQLAPLNTFFFKGTAEDLFKMYDATIQEIEADAALNSSIVIGCCSFAFNSFLNVFANNFMTKIKEQNTRMDYLSFHPYTDEGAGYGEAKVEIAKTLKQNFAPEADLINAEWGRLNSSFGDANWRSLEYGLNKVEAMINMHDHDIKMAHAATLMAIDDDQTSGTCCIGIYDVGPVKPKGSAYTYYYMNKINDHQTRIEVTGNGEERALAGLHPSGQSLMVIFAGANPEINQNDVLLNVSNLPWEGGYEIKKYRLDESVIEMDDLNFVELEDEGSNKSYTENSTYEEKDGSGALFLWHIFKPGFSSTQNIVDRSKFLLFPNPSQGNFSLSTEIKIIGLGIYSADGKLVFKSEKIINPKEKADYNPNLMNGFYWVQMKTENGSFTQKMTVLK